ncbi:beta-xylosidase [Naematelia encephala]|uniref:Beta-xylosidase n=1 Tax=Naematelia encephala TaxID=71784 RepID=A0A1Y2B6A6_9TREE|nr:beta-xylosidase [Naematelia encephala]
MPSPLITHIYTADPSAHSFNDRLYIYPSHDRETSIKFNDRGDQYDMVDYHVFSMDDIPSEGGSQVGVDGVEKRSQEVVDHGIALKVEDVSWVSKQLWAPDCARGKDGRWYLYFPARDKEGIFRIGVAVSSKPEGPFTPDPLPIPGSFSIDPASFVDTDGKSYLYFGGIWGGQLQCYSTPEGGIFDSTKDGPYEPSGPGVTALLPRVAQLSTDMHTFETPVRDIQIVDDDGKLLAADDHDRRFFEAAWMHKRNDIYYFSYSTGDTHLLVYATGNSPFGPFTFKGKILDPVLGWTTHHSIVQHRGKWYLFYHDCELSNGVDHLRSVKVREIWYDDKGDIVSQKPE